MILYDTDRNCYQNFELCPAVIFNVSKTTLLEHFRESSQNTDRMTVLVLSALTLPNSVMK